MHFAGWLLRVVVRVLFNEVLNYYDYRAPVRNIIGIMLTGNNRSTFRKKQSYYYCVHHKSQIESPGNGPGPLHQGVSKRVLVCYGCATVRCHHYESRTMWEITWKSVVSAPTLSTMSSAPSHTAKIINPVMKTLDVTRMLFPSIPAIMSDSVAYVERASMKNWWVRYKPYV